MLRKVPILSLFSFVLLLGLALSPSRGLAGDAPPLPENFYICHATGAEDHWVQNFPNNSGQAQGHIGHEDARDIIPPFEFNGGTLSQNWDAEGQAIHANNCVAPDEPTEVPPTEVPPTEVPPTDVPPTDVPPTDVPAEPTATTAPGEPTNPPAPTNAPAEPTATTQVSVLPVTGAEPGGQDGTAMLILLAAAAVLVLGGMSIVVRTRTHGR